MNYIILKCVEDKQSADINLYDVTDMLPDCFSDREYEHLICLMVQSTLLSILWRLQLSLLRSLFVTM